MPGAVEEMLRDATLAQRIRIAELEAQLVAVAAGVESVRACVREVQSGTAAALAGKLPAESIALIVQAHGVVLGALARMDAQLQLALSRPAEPQPLPANVRRLPVRRMALAVKPHRDLLDIDARFDNERRPEPFSCQADPPGRDE